MKKILMFGLVSVMSASVFAAKGSTSAGQETQVWDCASVVTPGRDAGTKVAVFSNGETGNRISITYLINGKESSPIEYSVKLLPASANPEAPIFYVNKKASLAIKRVTSGFNSHEAVLDTDDAGKEDLICGRAMPRRAR